MDTTMAESIREILGIPEGQPVILWEVPGRRDCPLAFHQQEQGLGNCPLGFDQREIPSQPEPWMRGRCEDESWKEWLELILEQCERCQGKARLSRDERQRLQSIQQSLFKRKTT